MTVDELLQTLTARKAWRPGRVKDLRTSLHYLAAALGAPSLDACPVDRTPQGTPMWLPALEAHFQALAAQGTHVSAATIANTKSNLRAVLRAAEAEGLLGAPVQLPLLPPPPSRNSLRRHTATAPYQATYRSTVGPRRFGLYPCDWPPDIVAGWAEYTARCGGRIRATTLQTYQERLIAYLGYIQNVAGRHPAWEDLFDPKQIQAFVHWHGTRVGRTPSARGLSVVLVLATMANVMEHPGAEDLAKLRHTFAPLEPVHDKDAHKLSLYELNQVAETCLREGRAPFGGRDKARNPGLIRATQFQKGLLLKMLVHIPLRQRNFCELRLGMGENLYQDRVTKHWHLRFRGAQLKVSMRKGKLNTYQRNLTTETDGLVEVLEEFLRDYRPRLLKGADTPFLFLTRWGRPFNTRTMRAELSETVFRLTGVRWYPHLTRTIWHTEYVEATGDVLAAATCLNDSPETGIKTYYNPVAREHYLRGKKFMATTALVPKTPAPDDDAPAAD
jgi:hypothetical protein